MFGNWLAWGWQVNGGAAGESGERTAFKRRIPELISNKSRARISARGTPEPGTWEVHQGKLFFRPSEKYRAMLNLSPEDLIPWVRGTPDFMKWAWKKKNYTIKATLTGVQSKDRDTIANELAEQGWEGATTATAVKAKWTTENLTPHHLSGQLIQLVNRDVHRAFRHTGSAAGQRATDDND